MKNSNQISISNQVLISKKENSLKISMLKIQSQTSSQKTFFWFWYLSKSAFEHENDWKKKLIKILTLVFFDFFLSFILYTDESKKKKFEIALHQIEKNEIEKLILFLFRFLNDVETKYWITKLKTKTLIWILTKFS